MSPHSTGEKVPGKNGDPTDLEVIMSMRLAVASLASTIDPEDDALVATTRGLEAIVDRRFLTEISRHRWYAVIGRGHIYAVTDISGQRISLQRLAYQLANPALTFDEIKHVSFINKIAFDCRVANLTDRVGRQAVMRNRRPKRETSSKYKGVRAGTKSDGSTIWRTQIKADFGSMSLGNYADEERAARVYDAAAFLLFGGSALYNFPGSVPDAETLAFVARHIARRKRYLQTRGTGQQAKDDL